MSEKSLMEGEEMMPISEPTEEKKPAPTRIKVSVGEVRERVMYLPLTCPRCGQDLTAKNSMKEWFYTSTSQRGHIDVERECFDPVGETNGGDDCFTSAFVCAHCCEVLELEDAEVTINVG